MKLKVRTNKGYLNINRPDIKAIEHHTGRERIQDYDRNNLNKRVEWDYEIKKYNNSGDCDGITIIQWEESPTTISKVFSGFSIWTSPLALRKREYTAHFCTHTKNLITEA